jgi:hypothetical protein
MLSFLTYLTEQGRCLMLSNQHKTAILTNDWSNHPYETWRSEAKKVKPNKLFMVTGKNFLNRETERYETACVTTHKLSEAKKFAAAWADKLGMTDIEIHKCSLQWEPCDE